MSFRDELERRSVFRVGAAYLIVAWVIAQVVSVVSDPLMLPTWFETVVVVLLAAGLPLALVLAWAYELTPRGIRRTRPSTLAGSRRRMSGAKLNYIVTGLLSLGMLVMAADVYVLRDARTTASDVRTELALAAELPPAMAERGTASGGREVERPHGAAVIAVLPFIDLSPDPANGFFAAGLREEIQSELAALGGLHVIGRGSAMRQTPETGSIPAIAHELGAQGMLEASVSYSDGRIALSVQLHDGGSGDTLWSKQYKRELVEIFEIRADITLGIAQALGVPLTATEQARIGAPRPESAAAYALYLHALAALEAGSDGEGLELLNRALAVDGNLAAAFARKAEFYALREMHRKSGTASDDAPPDALALQNADRALELDPDAGRAWYARGLVHQRSWRWDRARTDFEHAFELGAVDLGAYAAFMLHSGEPTRARELAALNVALDPKHAMAYYWNGYVLARLGRLDDALAALEAAASIASTDFDIQRGIAIVRFAIDDRAGAERSLRTSAQLLDDRRRMRYLPWFAYMYARLGRIDDVERLAREHAAAQQASVAESVWLYLALGRSADVQAWLGDALEHVEMQQRLSSVETLLAIKDNILNDPILDEPDIAALRLRLSALLEQ